MKKKFEAPNNHQKFISEVFFSTASGISFVLFGVLFTYIGFLFSTSSLLRTQTYKTYAYFWLIASGICILIGIIIFGKIYLRRGYGS